MDSALFKITHDCLGLSFELIQSKLIGVTEASACKNIGKTMVSGDKYKCGLGDQSLLFRA